MKPLSRRARRLLLILAVSATVVVVGVVGYECYMREHIKSIALEWARMNPLPRSASEIETNTGGSMFTRACIVRFTAPLADIDAWLAASPGTQAVTPKREGTVRKYSITPGGGAAFAELTIDEQTHRVTIHAYWS